MESNTTEETENDKPSPPTPSRRGKTLKIAKVVLVFEDGIVEQWEFPPGTSAFYREGGNRQTRPTASWKTHMVWWKSDSKVES